MPESTLRFHHRNECTTFNASVAFRRGRLPRPYLAVGKEEEPRTAIRATFAHLRPAPSLSPSPTKELRARPSGNYARPCPAQRVGAQHAAPHLGKFSTLPTKPNARHR